MDVITKTPGLQHISEDILKLLKTKGLMNCRLVNTSWKNVMNQSTFWLSKMKRQDITEDIQRSWKMLAQDLSNDQLSNDFVLILTKLVNSSQKKIKQDFGSFLGHFFTSFVQNGKPLSHQPLDIVVELKEANKYPDLMNFMLEHVDSNSKVNVRVSQRQRMSNNSDISRKLNPIQLAALYGLTKSVEKLMLRYEYLDVKTEDNESLIHLAVRSGNLKTIKVLRNFIVTQNTRGNTEIMHAVYYGRLDIVRFLKEHTDDPLKPNNQGFSPIHAAAQQGHLEILKYLVCLTDTPLAPNNFGMTPIHAAALKNQVECLKFLVRLTNSPIASANDGRTPIHSAALNGHIECLKVLVRLTDSPNVPMNNGKTPILLARRKGHKKTEKFLKQYCDLMN